MARLSRLTLLLFLLLMPLKALALALDKELTEVVRSYYIIAVYFGGPIATGVLIYAGYRYITSTGNPEALGEAKSLIAGAITGLLLLFLAGLIMSTIGV